MLSKQNILQVKLILFFICLFSIAHLQAQSILTDRPDQTEGSSTIGRGDLQIELGVLIGFTGESGNSTRQILAPTTLFRYGITKGIELRILSQFETAKTGDIEIEGISDLQIGTKIQILKDPTKNIEIAFLSHLIVPTGTTELSLDKVGSINDLSISHSLSENVGLGYNLGYNYYGVGQGDLAYTIALGVSVNDKVGVYIESFGDLVEFEDHLTSFDAGFTYLQNDQLQFDFSFGTGINHTMNYISLGFSWWMQNGTNE